MLNTPVALNSTMLEEISDLVPSTSSGGVACPTDGPDTLGSSVAVLAHCLCSGWFGTVPAKSNYDFMPFPPISRPQAENYWRI